MADGYWLLVKPLTPGAHVIHIMSDAVSYGFGVDVTYELTVL